eukprot:192876-Pyramimonas_sp.AAC.1
MATVGRSWELHVASRKCDACHALGACIAKGAHPQRTPCGVEEMPRLPRFGSVQGRAPPLAARLLWRRENAIS